MKLGLPSRPFYAIKNGTKKVEGRVPTEEPKVYKDLKAGNIIHFTNEDNGEKMDVKVKFIHHYEDTRSMLEKEGVENVLSGGGNIEDGIKSYNSFEKYEESIPKYGIYAIGVEPLI